MLLSVLFSSACHVCVAKEKMHVSSQTYRRGVPSCGIRQTHIHIVVHLSITHTHTHTYIHIHVGNPTAPSPTRQHVNDQYHIVPFCCHCPCMFTYTNTHMHTLMLSYRPSVCFQLHLDKVEIKLYHSQMY